MVHCIHHVPGRARFKVPRLKQDRAFAKELESKLASIEGVYRVEVNSSAWSVIVHYDAAANPLSQVIEHMRAGHAAAAAPGGDASAVTPPNASGRRPESHELPRGVGKVVGQAIFATVVQHTLERSLLAILLGFRR